MRLFAETSIDQLGNIFRLGIWLYQICASILDEVDKWAFAAMFARGVRCAYGSTHDFHRFTVSARSQFCDHISVADRLSIFQFRIDSGSRLGKRGIGRRRFFFWRLLSVTRLNEQQQRD